MADFTDQYNTELPAKDEEKFQAWLTESGRGADLADYDLRGWWKKNGTADERGHMTDEFKKPNHPTFSDESVYHGVDGHKGGKWSGSEKEGWKFKVGPSNLIHQTEDELKDYFARIEPDVELQMPGGTGASKQRSKLYPNSVYE